ncbi:MAG: hypothetical protein OXH39_08790 [Candidatus Poribacteria bacterium]|nr:hypothetical protein [Candidatus Poribacteria bacterium]
MNLFLRILSFLCALGISISGATFGNSDETPPKLIQELLEKEGATLIELKADPYLQERLRQQLYQKLNKPAPKRKVIRRMPRRTFVKLPPYCQTIVNNNLFRPLGYRKYEWTLKLELVGTMVYADSAKNTAVLQSNHPKYRRLIVKTGDTFLEEFTITRIEARKVSYIGKDGEQKYINLSPSPFGGGPKNPETEVKS